MYKIIGNRGTGKTTRLLFLAQEKGYTLVEPTIRMAQWAQRYAEEIGIQNVRIIGMRTFLAEYDRYRNKYLFDEIQNLFMELGIVGYSDNTNDVLETCNYWEELGEGCTTN